MENKLLLDILKKRYQELVEEEKKLHEAIKKHREYLCDQCLAIVDAAMKRIEGGEDLIVLKCVNWCCANNKTHHKPDEEKVQSQKFEENVQEKVKENVGEKIQSLKFDNPKIEEKILKLNFEIKNVESQKSEEVNGKS